MYDRKEAEGTKRRHQVDTVVEGMCVLLFILALIGGLKLPLSQWSFWCDSGINRMTNNIDLALPILDDAFRRVSVASIPSRTCLRHVLGYRTQRLSQCLATLSNMTVCSSDPVVRATWWRASSWCSKWDGKRARLLSPSCRHHTPRIRTLADHKFR